MMDLEITSAYVHIPFCRSKCYYCDFNSYADCGHLTKDYFEALKSEIKKSSEYINGTKSSYKTKTLKTVYFGGGTPTSVSPSYISEAIYLLDGYFGIDRYPEITIECNPGTVDRDMVREYKKCGINRVSIGLQSYSDRLLKTIGRTHSTEDFIRTFTMFKDEGFDDINVDIITGLPGQSMNDFVSTIRMLTEMKPEHVSVYSLSISEGSRFYDEIEKIRPLLPDDDEEREMYHFSRETLSSAGMSHYEISNFAYPGFECKHNVSCWKGKNYFGFGAGAHSYIGRRRAANCRSPEEYIRKVKSSGQTDYFPASETMEILTDKASEKEFFLLGFRLIDGISESEFTGKFHIEPDEYQPQLEYLVRQGLVARDADRLKLTLKGLDFANLVFREFI